MTERPRARSSVLLLVVALIACTSESGADGAYSTTDSAGVRIVESRAGAWGDDTVRIDPEPLLRIGDSEEGPYQFAFVIHGLLLPGGRIAVAEGLTREVRIFDSTGRHVSTFGRRGDGPGELQNIAGLFELPGDSLAVYDQRLRRTTVYSLSSDAHRTIRNPMEGNFSAFGVLASGQVLMYDPGRGYRPDLAPGLQWDTSDIMAVNLADGASHVVTRLASRQQFIEPNGDTRPLMPAHGSVQAATDDGFYWGTSDRYEIRFHDGGGRLRRILRRPVEPRAVEPAMIEEYIEANLDWVRRVEGEASVPRYRQRLEEGPRGEHVPLFEIAFVDRDGRLWVSAAVWPSLDPSPPHWSVFSDDGVLLGDVAAPERLRVVDGRDDVVLGIWRDSMDVPYVQLHRIVR